MTLLPNKHVSIGRSLVGTGAYLLQRLASPRTVNSLWESVKTDGVIANFRIFVLSVDYLYMIGAIYYEHGVLIRAPHVKVHD